MKAGAENSGNALSGNVTPQVFTIRIGDVSISIEGPFPIAAVEQKSAYRPFIREGKSDIRLIVHKGAFAGHAGKKVFSCPPIWSLFQQDRMSIIEIYHELSGLGRSLVISSDTNEAHLYFNTSTDCPIDPFFGPTLELLMVHHLALGKGIILHACGIARNGQGILFVGKSGAGKSTLANLWHREPGVDIFSDDRIIVRKQGEALWMYGTPWHGTARFSSPRSVQVEKIFFLAHGRENSVATIKENEAVAKLLTCSFPPHWDAAGMVFTLDLLNELVTRRPCRELTFRADRSAVEFVEKD